MKNKNSFIFKGLISLMLSLVMICGTAVTSLSAVTDQVVAAVKEPVRSAIPDAPAPAQATNETDIATQSASSAADYGVAEGSMLAEPADDEVLDVYLQSTEEQQDELFLSRKTDGDLAVTGATQVTGTLDTGKIYYFTQNSVNYTLAHNGSGWTIQRPNGDYLTGISIANNANWGNSALSFSQNYNSGHIFNADNQYLTYNDSSGFRSIGVAAAATKFTVYESSAVPTEEPTQAPTEAPTVVPTVAPTEAPTVAPTVAPTEAPTQPTTEPVTPTEAPSESTDSDSITYTKQIEKLSGDGHGDYDYSLHLTVDGSKLKSTTTVTTNETTGIVLLIDMAGDFNATWGTENNRPVSKDTIINRYVNKYLSTYSTNSKVDISVIAVKGVQSEKYDSDNVTKILSKWNNYNAISDSTFKAEEVHFGSNYTAGLMRGGEYVTENTSFDNKSIVFITNSDPLFGCNDDGTYYSGDGAGTAGVARSNVLAYMDKFFTDYSTTNLYMIDVPNESTGIHKTSQQMGAKAKEAGRGDFTTASNAGELDTAIGQAIEKILSGDKTSNITVTDTLSKYVDFATNKNLTATLYTNYDSSNGTWGTTQTFNESDAELSVIGDTVTFSRAAEIEGPFKLEIAFDIKTADDVYQDTDTYGATGYPNTGDENTDYGENTTSANKPGYYANSSATINYTLNGTAKSGTFIKPVVQAPAETPVQGKYIFQYTDRFGDTQKVTVPVTLNSREKTGYSGNGGQVGVPTFLWTNDAKTLYNNINPLVKAALALEGNEEDGGDDWQKDASVYKCDLVWDNLTATTQGANVSYNTTEHSVTIEATTTPYKFTLLYYTVNGGTATLSGTANDLEYGKAVTFNPIYKGSTEYAYVEYTVPSEGFSYWSADPEGNIPITTNLTYGMIMRGDYMHDNDNDRTVHIYAQYNKTPKKLWNPLIEEAKLTHTIDDDHDWVYLDYMTNYLSKDGTVVQEMEVKPEYGIVVAKYNSTLTTLTQEKMESVADKMIDKDKSSAYLDSGKTAIAYRFNYSDNEHISDFNRVLYTLKSDTNKAEEMQFTAIAYIIVDETTYYSLINTDITVIDLVQ